MTGEEMATQLRRELGRPGDDDRFPATDLTVALQQAERSTKRHFAMRQHLRHLILEDAGSPIAADDATGATYTLSAGFPMFLEVWLPPGWQRGRQLYPAIRGSTREGFFVLRSGEEAKVYMTRPYAYTPGLTVFGIFETATTDVESNPNVDSSLPEFLHEVQVLRAAAELAKRPHSRVNAAEKSAQADEKLAEVLTAHLFAVPGIEHETADDALWWRSPDLTS